MTAGGSIFTTTSSTGFSGSDIFPEDLIVFSEGVSGLSICVSEICRRLSVADARTVFAFVGVLTVFPFDVSPFLTFLFLLFLPFAALFLK